MTSIPIILLATVAIMFLILYFVFKNTNGETPEEKGERIGQVIGNIGQEFDKRAAFIFRLVPFNMKVILPLALIFITLHLLSDWTNYTVSKINPVALVFNNEMNQLWIAAKRFVFINGFVVLFVELVRFLPFFNKMKNIIEEVKSQYEDLTSWQKIKLYVFCLFGFSLEFIMLLQANLPVGTTLER